MSEKKNTELFFMKFILELGSDDQAAAAVAVDDDADGSTHVAA